MSSIEQIIQKACQEKAIPNAVVAASDKTGDFRYSHAFGVRSVETDELIQEDATMWIASCTKLLTAIAVMQCVEKGLLDLDADVSIILPELKDLPILKGFEKDGGKPILIPNTKIITLRHLLTHSSGLSYDIFNPKIQRYQKYQKSISKGPKSPTKHLIREKFVFPLLFTPGEGWEYSVGIDWAGQMVERVNQNIILEEYFQINIFKPLQINDMTFKPTTNALVQKNLTTMSWRKGDVNKYGTTSNPNGKTDSTTPIPFNATTESDDCHGGSGLFGSVPSLQKITHALLLTPSPLLSPSSIEALFTPQLSPSSRIALAKIRTIPEMNTTYGYLDPEIEADFGVGGILNMQDLKSGRKAGSIAWGGYPNLFWWIDRSRGVSGVWGTQLCPPGDEGVARLFRSWEGEVYRGLKRGGKEKL